MPKQASKTIKRNPRLKTFFWVIGAALGLGALLAVSGFAFAATRESHDAFCASCHTEPESTYYQRSLEAPVDLASFHTGKQARCIDCHSGENVTGRIQAELLGAHNALAYLTHSGVSPAKLTRPIGDTNCLKCHTDIAKDQDFNNHFHIFLSRWQQLDTKAAKCVSCHSSHTTDGQAEIGFLNEARTQVVCDDCHRIAGEGE